MDTLTRTRIECMSLEGIVDHHEAQLRDDPRILTPSERETARQSPSLDRLVEQDRKVLEDTFWQLGSDICTKASTESGVHRILAMGATVEDAIADLCKRKGWDGPVELRGELTGGDPDEYDWGYRFLSDGTSMKCAGKSIPGGGFVITWWK